jgi:hypothetical protein
VKLGWMLLANHAEVNNGLLYIAGGTWDTSTVHAPPEGLPEGSVAQVTGTLVIRLLFHVTETDRDHTFTVTLMDEDGGEVGKIEGGATISRIQGLPPGWDQGLNLAIPLTGIPLPRFGLYNLSVQVDGQHLGDLPFRVLKDY